LSTALLVLHLAAAARSVQDDRGRSLDASEPARRVVALAPHLAELMHEADAAQALVATVRGADYPDALAAVPRVGDAGGIDIERVLALRPDLVLAWGSGNRAADIDRLEALGLRVFVSEPRALSDAARTLRALAALTGRAGGERQARRYEARLAALRAPAGEPVRVFVQIWDRPVMTVNGQHLISQALRHCGGHNVFHALPALSGSVAREAVLAADPQVLLLLPPPGRAGEWAAEWSAFERLRARPRVVLDPDLLTRATSRLLDGVQAVCSSLSAQRRSAAGR